MIAILISRPLTAALLTLALLVHAPAGPAAAAPAPDVPAPWPARSMQPASKAVAAAVAGRGSKPLHTATGPAPGQAGYVHYFLLHMPDDSLEVQVGIELADERIAWSFPDLGVVISPFIDGAAVEAGGKSYGVWHLYGLRPFPDAAAMARLQKELPGRIARGVRAQTPYCLDDGPQGDCMSCLGFVLRALFPGRRSDYPDMPRDFWHTGNAARYTPNDLLLYLTGMLDLPNRNARLQRIARLDLPTGLREDLEELVHAMGSGDTAAPPRAAVPLTARQKRAGGGAGHNVAPQSPRRKP